MPIDKLVRQAAVALRDAFIDYNQRFEALSAASLAAFNAGDWSAANTAAQQRIDLYDQHVDAHRSQLIVQLGERADDATAWSTLKRAYDESTQAYLDRELFRTYFNSVSRRSFATVGVNRVIEFVDIDATPIDDVNALPALNIYPLYGDLEAVADKLLADYAFATPYADAGGCADYVAARLREIGRDAGGSQRLELHPATWIRGRQAYLIGRLFTALRAIPIYIALDRRPAGIRVDAVVASTAQMMILFGFTRAYFHVALDTISDTVVYLHELMPDKPIGELYTAVGRAKQGKTERYRALFRQLRASRETFIPAPGHRGMVMAVFTMANLPVVFKVIRDRFNPPKTVTRDDVLAAYKLVFRHDRAGRLVDAQEFKRLRFPIALFGDAVRDELLGECAQSVHREGDHLVIDHLYIERKLIPLNLFLQDMPASARRAAIADYAHAIADLAACNIFSGDLLQKNFGVTDHGRVIFYDYDELCHVTDCRFRRLPKARDDAMAYSDQTWFHVAPEDVFPEQFRAFLALNNEDFARFEAAEPELLTPTYWNAMKTAHLERRAPTLQPYPPEMARERRSAP